MKAVIYTRISTHNQRHGKGLELQKKACQLEVIYLAQKRNVEITRILVFSDVISGKSPMMVRDGLCEALGSLCSGDLFVIDDIERLARNDTVLDRILDVIFTAKAELIVVSEVEKKFEQDFRLERSSVRKIIASEKAAIKKVKEKRKRKERIGNIPFGYCLAKNGRDIKRNAKEQRILKKIERDRSKGKSFRVITIDLNTKGYINRKCKPFTINQVCKISKLSIKIITPVLRNPPYGLKIVDNEYVINFLEQQMIEIIMDLFQQEWPVTKITAHLNSLGFRNRKNNEIHVTQTKRIIKREFLNKSFNNLL
jgi:DNA invertase Pin-like site-specific DNA recombinase